MTEIDDLRQTLRRAEARVQELRDGNAKLESVLLRPNALRRSGLVALVVALVAGSTAYIVAASAGDARAEREHLRDAQAWSAESASLRPDVDSCRDALMRTIADVNRCRATLGQPPLPPARVDSSGRRLPSACRCEPGDPLCVCF
jgi:hypothetical protein